MSYQIRKAVEQDLPKIVDFQLALAQETENLVLDFNTVQQGVQNLFRQDEKGCYWVAEHQNQIVGSLLMLLEWSDWRNGEVLWIHSLYVISEYRNKGIFKAFYQTLQTMVRNNSHYKGIRLYVDKRNALAQKAYISVGMSNEHYELFEWLK